MQSHRFACPVTGSRNTESKSNPCPAWITCWIIPFSRFLSFHRELWNHGSLFKWNGYVRARSSVHERDEEDPMNTVSTLRNSIAVLVEADKSEQKFRRSIPLWLCYIVYSSNWPTSKYRHVTVWSKAPTLCFFVYLMRYRYCIFSFCFRAIFSLDSFILSLCKVKCIVCIVFEIIVFNIYRDK